MDTQSLTTTLRRWLHAQQHWLLGLPGRIWLVAAACFALNAASNLGNSFGNAPHFGGPVVALATLLAFATFFALALWAIAAEPAARLGARWAWLALPRARPYLVYPLLALALWTGVQSLAVVARLPHALASPSHYGSDEMYYAHYNAWLLLHRQNPYGGDRLSGALRYFDTDAVTPLRVGAYSDPLHPPTKEQTAAIVAAYLADPQASHPNLAPATTHSYPALSFLLAVPSVWAAVPTLGYGQVLGLLALIGAIIAAAPARLRPIIALLCLLDTDGIRSVASSDFAIWTAAGVALVWLLARLPLKGGDVSTERHGMVHGKTRNDAESSPRAGGLGDLRRGVARWHILTRVTLTWPTIRPWLPAIALGLVCAVQQTAWFFAPFYLVWVWRSYDIKRAIDETGIAVGAFLLVNLPWIVSAPGPWLHSLFLPVTLPLFPTGGGLVGLGLGGATPLLPPIIYALLEVGAYLGLLTAYARWFAHWPLAGLLLPMVALLLAWRSPSRYFILLPFLAIMALVMTLRQGAVAHEGEL